MRQWVVGLWLCVFGVEFFTNSFQQITFVLTANSQQPTANSQQPTANSYFKNE